MDGEWMEGDAATPVRDGAIDLPQLLRAIARRKWRIIVPTCLAFGLALAAVVLLTPRYTGVAKVLLENQESYYTRPDKASAEPAPTLDAEAVQSEAETITSPALARKAIARLDLVHRREFNRAASRNPISIALTLLGLSGSSSPQAAETRLVDAFLSRLTAFPVAKTRVLQIEFVSEDPELAARGANVVAQLFLEQQEAAKEDEAKNASAWLSAKIDDLRSKVADADAKVENFRAESGLLAGANNMTVPGQQLADLNAQVANARAAQSAALAKAQLLRGLLRDGRLSDVPELTKDESLRRYAEQRVALQAQIAEESRTYLPGHPRMKELAAQLGALDHEIRLAIEKSARGLEDDARLAAAQVDSLEKTLAAQSKTVASGDVEAVRLRALELDSRTARDQLESYLQKYREAVAREASNASPADARIIAIASPPRSPTFPKKIETLTLGTLAGLILSTAVVLCQALLAGAPVVAAAPAAPVAARGEDEAEGDERQAAAASDASSEAAGEFAAGDFYSPLALAERLASAAFPGVTLLTLIAGQGSDRSLATALAVARHLSDRGPAVLVDLDPSPDWFMETLDRDEGADRSPAGVAELLAGEASFAEALRRDLSSHLDIIAAGAGAGAAEGLDEALGALVAAYDFVVVHAADWRSEPALEAMDVADRAVLVASAPRLRSAVTLVRQAMGVADECVMGFVEDGARVERAA